MFPGGYVREEEVEFLGVEYAFMQLHAIKKLYIPKELLLFLLINTCYYQTVHIFAYLLFV